MTFKLLQQHGYDRLTIDAVAAEAKASKTTLYRRWPTKAALVLAAVNEGIRAVAVPPHTGSLRDDLLAIGAVVCQQAGQHAATMRAVLNETSRNPELTAALHHEILHQRQTLITGILSEAANRGEIDPDVINPEIWDLLPGYLVFRSVISPRPPTVDTVRVLVDDVLLPSLTRCESAERVQTPGSDDMKS